MIRQGRVIDPESGLDAVRNIGIRGGRIASIATDALRGRTVIDASGLVVAPGFIDLLELEVGTADVDAWYAALEPGRLVNYGVAIGHIPVRMKVLGDSGVFLPSGLGASGTLTDTQRVEMFRLDEAGLRQGAVAVGMGLAYTPSAMEALEVFRLAGRHGAVVHVHLRGGMSSLIEAIGDAAISGAPLHVVHVNSSGGRQVQFYLAAIEDARRRGLDVTTEAYPYTAGATRIESALYDNWESWPDERFAMLQWVATGERLTRRPSGSIARSAAR